MVKSVETAIIYRGERARPLVQTNVDRLGQSIKEVGLLNPIIVRPVQRYHGGVMREVFEIVAGCHRYAAICSLNWTHVDCKVIEGMDDLKTELAEIDENLMRANLSPAQEAAAIARRKDIYETLHPETRHGAFHGNQHRVVVADSATTNFTTHTAESTGKSERTVREAVTRAKRLGSDIDLVAGTSLDRAGELDALAKMTAEDRKPIIDRARAGEKVSAKPFKVAADPASDAQAMESQVARLMSAWNAAGPDAREEFLLRIDQPVFDQGQASRDGSSGIGGIVERLRKAVGAES